MKKTTLNFKKLNFCLKFYIFFLSFIKFSFVIIFCFFFKRKKILRSNSKSRTGKFSLLFFFLSYFFLIFSSFFIRFFLFFCFFSFFLFFLLFILFFSYFFCFFPFSPFFLLFFSTSKKKYLKKCKNFFHEFFFERKLTFY